MPARAVRVRSGLYELCGVLHTRPRYPGGPVCGGQVFAERLGGSEPAFWWECYCERCQDCDPNGWRSLAECVAEAPGFWGEED